MIVTAPMKLFFLRRQLLPVFTLIPALFFSCKTLKTDGGKETGSDNRMMVKEEVLDVQPVKITLPIPSNDTVRFAYLVSFYSPGDGIDIIAAENFEAFLNNEKQNSSGRISYLRVNWGREGERDYCVELKGLTVAEEEIFDKAMRELLSKATKVNIYRHYPCRYLNTRDLKN
jgi:hypothetical protein